MQFDLQGKGILSNNITHVSAREAVELLNEGAILVDIREEYDTEVRKFDIENSLLIPNSIFYQQYHNLPKQNLLIIADCVGLRSKEAVLFLQNNGFENVVNLAGGIMDWEIDGCKVIKKSQDAYNGQCACVLKNKSGKKINFK